jgi:glutathione peroxidase
MDKVATKGADQSPVYRVLTTAGPPETHGDVKWNFTKFLVDKEGKVVARFESKTDPLAPEVKSAIDRALAGG